MGERSVTRADAVNLYILLLGRDPESELVTQQQVGRPRDQALSSFLQSEEFREAVFEPAVQGNRRQEGWRLSLLSSEFMAWMNELLEAEGSFELYGPEDEQSITWTSALLQTSRNSPLFKRLLPEELYISVDKFEAGLRKIQADDDASVQEIASSDLFDASFYERQIPCTFAGSVSAARHYLFSGAAQGVRPSRLFDAAYYLSANDDVRDSGSNPLLHYIRDGRDEGRLPRPSRSLIADKPEAPARSAWQRIAADPSRPKPSLVDNSSAVDVIVPVYRGYHDTLACIHSVLASHSLTPFRLIVIDDQSPELDLSAALSNLAAEGLIELHRNEENLGFVATVNKGMSLSSKRDVILLNSDTEVFGDWIDRLRRQAYSGSCVATVTPLSNNATIFSYPHRDRDNNQMLEIAYSEIDSLAATCQPGAGIPVPTGVGFCFYIRRDALTQIGFFDVQLFRKGYGEENDFCMRAIEHGWENRAAFDVFVRHTGEVSFAAGAKTGKMEGYISLIAAHPRYERLVHDFIRRDPFRIGRTRLDVARLRKAAGEDTILFIEHGWGGGIERHINDLAELMTLEGATILVAAPQADRSRSCLRMPASDEFPNLPELDWSDLTSCVSTLKMLGITRVHIHSVVGIPAATVRSMQACFAAADLSYDVTVHDYTPVCPRITMIDWSGSFCRSPSPLFCERCIERGGTPFGSVDIYSWRRDYQQLINNAEKVLVPDQDLADRLNRYVELERPLLVRPHPTTYKPSSIEAHTGKTDGIRRVGLIGALGEHKGSKLLRLLCVDALERRLPLQFVLYGFTDRPEEDIYPNLIVTGSYREKQLPGLIKKQPCDLVLFLSVGPETFSYTLDHAFAHALFPVSFDLGAIASRIKATGFGQLLPLEHMFSPSRINDALLEIEIQHRQSPVREVNREWTSYKHYYDISVS